MFTIIGGDGKEYGPVSTEQVRNWLANGRANLETKAKAVGSEEWGTLGDFPEFSGQAAMTPPVVGTAATPVLTSRIEFTGEWTEYFKIWIVNVLLTIVTLGIYAAWAKVRKRRYFHANTKVFGHAFEYLADPVRILFGNLIVVGLFAIYSLSGAISPLVQLPFLLVLLVLMPWIIVRAYAFNARNTAWRGLRFHFSGTYGGAAIAFLLRPLLIPFTLGGIVPYVLKRQKEFVVTHHGYGTTRFGFSGRAGSFYKIYAIAALFFLPIVFCYVVMVGMAVAGAMAQRGGAHAPPPAMAFVTVALMLVGLPLALVGSLYFRSRLFNLVWNHTSLAGVSFSASMRARDLFLINLVNGLVTIVTFGLMYPWAAVRLARFQLGCLTVTSEGPIDAFVDSAQPPVSAIGDAASGLFDFDLGFGL